jgi:hypothetical protein
VLKDLNFSIFSLNKMDNIIEPNDTFDFSKLSLAHPTGIQGGAYFTSIEYNKKPLYIQTCKSLTKQGFVKTGKKYYCDLMFDKNSESLINWFENLEERCQKLIFEKRNTWFQNALEETDIETAFNSTIRVYKSGKCYLVRTNIKNNNSSNLPAIKIYDEKEIPLTMTDITNETNIICILEIQGIKFTSRNFQIEIELKQVMVLDNEPVFDNCMIKPNKQTEPYINDVKNEQPLKEVETAVLGNEQTNLDSLSELNVDNKVEENNENTLDNNLTELEPIDIMSDGENNDDNISLDLEIEDLDIETNEEDNDALKEFNVDFKLDSLETLQLKKPNQVYFELYKEARNKAKMAKKNAILAYLEAKNIKKTYLIENINDSDSDFDAEIDDVSESELEGL